MSAAGAGAIATILFFIFFSGFNTCPSELYFSDFSILGVSFGLCGGTVTAGLTTGVGCLALRTSVVTSPATYDQYNVELTVGPGATWGFGFRTALPGCFLTSIDTGLGFVSAITVRNVPTGYNLCAKSKFSVRTLNNTPTDDPTCAQIALLPPA